MAESGVSIKSAARLSGLSAHVIRAWEKRYAAVAPGRSENRRRLYSSEEIARLDLLRRATEAGHAIGCVVRLSEEDLHRLLGGDPVPANVTPFRPPEAEPAATLSAEEMLTAAYAAVAGLQADVLERLLHTALVAWGRGCMTQRLLVPLIHRIGEAWQSGELRIAHEHVASAVIRTFLGNFVRQHSENPCAPVLLVTTPAGQLHELGALLAAAAASDLGWKVTYLGPNLPPEEIAGAFLQNSAQAVALSIVYPGDDPGLPGQLLRLRQFLPPGAPVFAGGRAAPAYAAALEAAGIALCDTCESFHARLNACRVQCP
jgi:MerR family transcriptional regulator, light-induced transcriptional regulator